MPSPPQQENPMKKIETVTVVVLNDGETFTDVRGCSIMVVPAEQYERVIAEGGDAKDFEPIVEIGLVSHIVE
jgi:hypothetical protein